jgi:hypothetical protein
VVYIVNISNVLNEDTGDIGVIHVQVPSEAEGKALIAEIVAEENADPADFTLVTAPSDWACVGHGDGPLCTKPRLN